ncbi:MAG TPA: ORF6N domain-containing protein [Deltaproteobacteria bacterium]|nr:ORF6N domain-containing protein [Deltaproteobacteria bacterium]
MKKRENLSACPGAVIERRIYSIRGHKVLLDLDIAELYGVETKVFTQAVKRNRNRFPDDFMFQLTREEYEILRSQIVTSSWGGRRYLPYAFTEQGVAMLSSILRSHRAIAVNIEIMRAFVKLREMVSTHKKLAAKLEELEQKYDEQFKVVFDVLHQLLDVPQKTHKRIGFVHDDS